MSGSFDFRIITQVLQYITELLVLQIRQIFFDGMHANWPACQLIPLVVLPPQGEGSDGGNHNHATQAHEATQEASMIQWTW